MRWILFLLVTLNLLFYLNHQLREPLTAVKAQSDVQSPKSNVRLLSEVSVKSRRSEAPQVAAQSGCLFLGGSDEESLARAVEQRLLSLDIHSQVQSVDVSAGVDYWVYLPPLVSRQASLRLLRELQSRNIDSYIITVGDLENGISLGIFSRKDSTESVISRLREVDYDALVRELPRMHRKYWVRLEGSSRDLLTDALLQELNRDFPLLERRQMPCSSIATSE